MFQSTFLATTSRPVCDHVALQPCWIRSFPEKANDRFQASHAVVPVFVNLIVAVRPVGHVDAEYATLHPAGGAVGTECSATQFDSHANAEFQLTVTSFSEYASMWSTQHRCGAHPGRSRAAIGSCSALFGPPDNAPGGAVGSEGSSWFAQCRWCTLRTGWSPQPATYEWSTGLRPSR